MEKSINKAWENFTSAIYHLLHIRLNEPNAFIKRFDHLFESTKRELQKHKTSKAIENAWKKREDDPDFKDAMNLLLLEIQSFPIAVASVIGVDPIPKFPQQIPPRSKWKNKKISAKKMLEIAKIILSSLVDLLGGVLPSWIKAILKIFDEVLSIASS